MDLRRRRVVLVVADHQVHVYCGRAMELFVGTLCLVNARVYIAELKGEHFVGLTVAYPR